MQGRLLGLAQSGQRQEEFGLEGNRHRTSDEAEQNDQGLPIRMVAQCDPGELIVCGDGSDDGQDRLQAGHFLWVDVAGGQEAIARIDGVADGVLLLAEVSKKII